MKIVAISDLHGYLPPLDELPEGDVLCICGDIVPLDYQNSDVKSVAWFCLEFVPWVDATPYEKVIFIAGNHDFFLDDIGPKKFKGPGKTLSELLPGDNKGRHKLVYLCDSMYEYNGVKFYGTPWCADLSRWAFYKPSESSVEYGKGLKETFEEIPFQCDVIMTHMPPRIGNAGVVLQHGSFNTLADYGSQDLADAIYPKMFKYLLCGHVHSGDHKPCDYDGNGRYIVNVSLKDEAYKVTYKPFVFEIQDRKSICI